MIIRGPFKFSRHPMYLGMTAILLGEAILLGSPTALIAPFGFFVVMQAVFIPIEERSMSESFGEEYTLYRKKARMWL